MVYYKSARYIDGKTRIVITDENGNIIDKNPVLDIIIIMDGCSILEELISLKTKIMIHIFCYV